MFSREIVERKLTAVGALPGNVDRQEVYDKVYAAIQKLEGELEQ